jgi:hypothetical protein
VAHEGGVAGRMSDLDRADGRSLQSPEVMAWIVPDVSCRVVSAIEHPFSATETRR